MLKKYMHNHQHLYDEQSKKYSGLGVDLFSCYENTRMNCVNCESSFESTFLDAMSKININPAWTFMDCGSGLGVPIFLASNKFLKLYGVENDKFIAEKSIHNLDILKVKNAEIIISDIRHVNVEILNSVNVFYLFNPFTANIFEEFVGALESSLRKYQREVWVIYLNPTCEDCFKKVGNVLSLEFSVKGAIDINYYHGVAKI